MRVVFFQYFLFLLQLLLGCTETCLLCLLMKGIVICLGMIILLFIEMENLFIYLQMKEQVCVSSSYSFFFPVFVYLIFVPVRVSEYDFYCVYTGSGFVSHDLYLHGFFSASIKLPADYTAGVVVAFYVSHLSNSYFFPEKKGFFFPSL